MTLKLLRPIAALTFVSMVGCFLLGARSVVLGPGRHLNLVWNLFLAWLPLWLAIGLQWWSQGSEARRTRWVGRGLGVAWLLFFPNAAYLLTDLVHLGARTRPHYWVDLVLILVFALAGLVLSFVSLFVVQRLVARRFGWVIGWGFVGVSAILNGFGIYAGRFLRWNSWDVVSSPWSIWTEGVQWVAGMRAQPNSFWLPILFGVLTFLAYVMLYGLTQLQMSEETRAFSGTPAHPRSAAGDTSDATITAGQPVLGELAVER